MRVEKTLIAALNAHGEMSTAELAALTKTSASAVASALSRLFRFGCVKKRRYVSGEVTWLPKVTPDEFAKRVKEEKDRARRLMIIGSPLRVFVRLEPQYGLILKQLSEETGLSTPALIADAVRARIPYWLSELVEPATASAIITRAEREAANEQDET